jgi:hypothetical protein
MPSSQFPHFAMSPRVEAPARMRHQFDDMFYDASEEESEFEMDTTAGFEKLVPILERAA